MSAHTTRELSANDGTALVDFDVVLAAAQSILDDAFHFEKITLTHVSSLAAMGRPWVKRGEGYISRAAEQGARSRPWTTAGFAWSTSRVTLARAGRCLTFAAAGLLCLSRPAGAAPVR